MDEKMFNQPARPAQPVTPMTPEELIKEAEATEPTQPVAQPAAQPEVQPVAEKPKNNKTLIALVVILVVAVLAAGGALLAMNWNTWFGTKTDSGTSNTPTTPTVVENTELQSGTVSVNVGGRTITYAGAYIVDGIEATIGSGTYESAVDNQAVFVVANGGSLVIDGEVTINKTGSADFNGRGDDYSFYGLNSAIVVAGEGSEVTINGATITTSTSGANAVVATGGGFATVGNTVISTSNDGSRGLHATYGSGIEADAVEITTLGQSSAALATDRGSGAIKAVNMTLSTSGAGSPLIYSTGTIAVSESTGMANGAQIAVVEGKNSIELDNCEFSANGNGNRNGVDNAGVMIYQSMSGDADQGKGTFVASGCEFRVLDTSSVYASTPFFFVTNTTADITVANTTIDFSPAQYLVSALGTSEWGQAGSNGGIVTISLTDVEATNTNANFDSISSVTANQ